MKFDPDSDYAKHRDATGGLWFIQNGHEFTVRGKYIGPVDKVEGKKEAKKQEEKQAIRKRAAKKLDDFSDKTDSAGPIADALKENRAAVAAEEISE